MNLSDTEIRVLQSIHLRGYSGNMGSMNFQQRKKLMLGLVEKKLLTENLKLTELGIQLSSPNNIFNKSK